MRHVTYKKVMKTIDRFAETTSLFTTDLYVAILCDLIANYSQSAYETPEEIAELVCHRIKKISGKDGRIRK